MLGAWYLEDNTHKLKYLNIPFSISQNLFQHYAVWMNGKKVTIVLIINRSNDKHDMNNNVAFKFSNSV